MEEDVKKGEKIIKSKCKNDRPLKDDDEAPDGGHKGGKSVGSYMDDVGSSGAYVKPTIRSSGKVKGIGKPSGRRRALVTNQTQELITTVTITTTTTNTQIFKVINADNDQAERIVWIVEANSETRQFMQTLKLRGKTTTLFYKDPKIHKFNDVVALKLSQKDNPKVDLEQIRKIKEEFALQKSQSTTDFVKKTSDVPKRKRTLRHKEKDIVIKELSQSNSDRNVIRVIRERERLKKYLQRQSLRV